MVGIAEAGGYAIVGMALAVAAIGLTGAIRRWAWDSNRRSIARQVFSERARVLLDNAKAERERTEFSWNGVRKFVVAKKVPEARDICSFYLEPHDKKPLPPYHPGQYLTFKLKLPDQVKPVVRCYSLSDWTRNSEGYRVTIKHLHSPGSESDAPPGLVSSFFHEELQEGAIVDVMAPSGNFRLDLSRRRPIVMVAGGIGVTPLLAMLNAICDAALNVDAWLFYCVRCRADHAMYEHLKDVSKTFGSIRTVVCYSRPTAKCVKESDYDHEGRIDLTVLRQYLPSNNFEFYVCGPAPMMAQIRQGLAEWGVPREDIHFEAFGADSVKSRESLGEVTTEPFVERAEVVFAKSGKTLQWSSDDGVLLEFAERHGLAMESGCRAGNCGTCILAVKEGDYAYMVQPGAATEQGTCLACIATPRGRLVLDA